MTGSAGLFAGLKVASAIAVFSGSCNVPSPIQQPPSTVPLAPTTTVVDDASASWDWHFEYTLFEDGSGVNADGVAFCVWHTDALCTPRSESSLIPAGAQEEFARIQAEGK